MKPANCNTRQIIFKFCTCYLLYSICLRPINLHSWIGARWPTKILPSCLRSNSLQTLNPQTRATSLLNLRLICLDASPSLKISYLNIYGLSKA
ncbi:unnamed protein product [Blepharisma stoltei]|uniref:Uncharacterized protein n=1 Tax=Blepharisma stoltei TaxID=1481888 RepID=A0AAU9IY90_9CILI|nr:unnamed protein product [Blepharisma stoltei]